MVRALLIVEPTSSRLRRWLKTADVMVTLALVTSTGDNSADVVTIASRGQKVYNRSVVSFGRKEGDRSRGGGGEKKAKESKWAGLIARNGQPLVSSSRCHEAPPTRLPDWPIGGGGARDCDASFWSIDRRSCQPFSCREGTRKTASLEPS